jgi:hypothetical protein
MKNRVKLLLINLIIYNIMFSFFIGIANAEGQGNDIDLSTNPQKVFFDIQNAKPGDTYIKILNVQNNGEKDFNYLFSSYFLSESKNIYNQLLLKVEVKDTVLFNGKLMNFEKLKARILKKKTNENLTFSIYFPIELGNEFQDANCEFQFKFYVEGTLGGLLPANGPNLPNTGTDIFNYIVGGSVLIITGLITQYFILKRKKSDSII